MCGTDCFLMLLSVLFPPIGVWVKRGICGADSLINIALCCLGFLPGLLHAWYIILQYPDQYEYDSLQQDGEHGRSGDGSVTYYYVARGPAPRGQQQPNYGTVPSQPTAGQFPGQQQSGTMNAFPAPKKNTNTNAQPQHGVAGNEISGEGSSQPAGPPPTYADVIKGDHKVQTP